MKKLFLVEPRVEDFPGSFMLRESELSDENLGKVFGLT